MRLSACAAGPPRYVLRYLCWWGGGLDDGGGHRDGQEEAAQRQADHLEAQGGRGGALEGPEVPVGLSKAHGLRADVLPLTEGARRTEARPGEAAQGARSGELSPEAHRCRSADPEGRALRGIAILKEVVDPRIPSPSKQHRDPPVVHELEGYDYFGRQMLNEVRLRAPPSGCFPGLPTSCRNCTRHPSTKRGL